ncbi:hypothetical protein [Dyella sp.]|jgi:hypothetical protein|uniref:PepSY domain-containing protein n=1 Tax=Dyella sp. TaxID=1869338 RepID=UPI002D7756D6|nr:hypothetical protein [Dyella sp.]HET6432984.1 hypothetical protein [Dyella sp.]
MTLNTLMLSRLLAAMALSLAAPAWAQQGGAPTLDQAVKQVQQDTGGKVLSADRREFGRKSEFRVKVLTPEGHVRVVVVPGGKPAAVPARPASSSPRSRPRPAINDTGKRGSH